MKILLLLLNIFAMYCNASTPVQQSTPVRPPTFDFEKASEGKRIFVVSGPEKESDSDSHYNQLYHFCDTFDEFVCIRPLADYQGKKGFLVEKVPFITDQYSIGYHIVMETGEQLVFKLSNVYKGKDPIESSFNLIDANNIAHAESYTGTVLSEGLTVTVVGHKLSGRSIYLILSNGEKIYQSTLENRLQFLNDFVDVGQRDKAFTTLSNLELKFDDFDAQWWIRPKHYMDMQLHAYIVKHGKSKLLRMEALYEGTDWIFVNRISIMANGKRYDKTLNYNDVIRDAGNGKVWETIDRTVTPESLAILKTLGKGTDRIRFYGRFQSTETISVRDAKEIKAVLWLYDTI